MSTLAVVTTPTPNMLHDILSVTAPMSFISVPAVLRQFEQFIVIKDLPVDPEL